jgi:hypothetical protein
MTIPLNNSSPAIVDLPRPKDVGILAMETYFPRRVCECNLQPVNVFDETPHSASLRLTWKFSMVSQKANIQLDLVRSIWLVLTTARTSIRSL